MYMYFILLNKYDAGDDVVVVDNDDDDDANIVDDCIKG